MPVEAVGDPVDPSKIPRENIGLLILKLLQDAASDKIFLKQHNGAQQQQLTYGQVLRQTLALCSALSKRGLKPGDVVMIAAQNRVEFGPIFYATLLIRAILTTAVPHSPKELLAQQFANCCPHIVFADGNQIESLRAASSGHDTPIFVALHDDDCKRKGSSGGCESYDEFLSAGDDGDARADDERIMKNAADVNVESHIALLLYTSGTSGVPKGVAFSHYCLNARYFAHDERKTAADDNDKMCLFTPMCHAYAFGNALIVAPRQQKTVVFIKCPPTDPESIFQCIHEHQPKLLWTTPPVQILMMKHPARKKYNLKSFFATITGASPFPAPFERAFAAEYPQQQHLPKVYGSTELSGVTMCGFGDKLIREGKKAGTSGTALRGCTLRICDLNTGENITESGKCGEIRVKSGPSTMNGYWKQAELTRRAFDADGFFRTGDYGYIDTDGYLFALDRIADLIHVSNDNIVCPSLLEGRLFVHEGVADVGVVGVPSCSSAEIGYKQVPRAYCVPVAGYALNVDELIEFADKQAENDWEKLRGGVVIVDALPRSTASKIKHDVLREMSIARS